MPHNICQVEGCGEQATSRNAKYCKKHTHLGREAQKAAAAASLHNRWAV